MFHFTSSQRLSDQEAVTKSETFKFLNRSSSLSHSHSCLTFRESSPQPVALQFCVGALLNNGGLRCRVHHSAVDIRRDIIHRNDVAAGTLAYVGLLSLVFGLFLLCIAARVRKTLLVRTTLQYTVALGT